MVDAFSCIETPEMLLDFNSKVWRGNIKHSKAMEDFLKKEALEEQDKGLNTTCLLTEKRARLQLMYHCSDLYLHNL